MMIVQYLYSDESPLCPGEEFSLGGLVPPRKIKLKRRSGTNLSFQALIGGNLVPSLTPCYQRKLTAVNSASTSADLDQPVEFNGQRTRRSRQGGRNRWIR